MNTVKSKVVNAQFRSATASRMQAMFEMMQRSRQVRTNGDEFDVSSDVAVSPQEKPEAVEPVETVSEAVSVKEDPSRNSGKTIGDVFASMMSRPPMPRQMAPRGMTAQAQDGAQMVGRNDPCPCGSGKKYKKCCGRNLV